MGIETERKFLLSSDGWRDGVVSITSMRQGYLAVAPERSVRVRIAGPVAWLTLKFGGSGLTREEYEYEVPVHDAEAMFVHATSCVEKDRHFVPWEHLVFEIDVFRGRLAGLALAELEINEAGPPVNLPGWVGREVTDDPRYYNAVLARDGIPSGTVPPECVDG